MITMYTCKHTFGRQRFSLRVGGDVGMSQEMTNTFVSILSLHIKTCTQMYD